MTRPFTRAAAVLLAAFTLLFCACTGKEPSEPERPRATEPPQVEYTVTHMIRYWPEDADYDSCDYACTVEIPEFKKSYTAGYNMNKAVDAYIENLASRIENGYMKAAEVDPPVSEVSCEVGYARGFTNVIFTEKHSYTAKPYYSSYVLMLDENGDEISLCDLFLNYHAEQLIAEKLSEKVCSDPDYFEALPNDILPLLDIRHGAYVTEDGCCVFIREGALAPEDKGELRFMLGSEDIVPEPVSCGAITPKEYRSLIEFLAYVSDALVVRTEQIENGVLSPYAATSFMGELVNSLGYIPEAGRIELPREEFLSLYRSCFGAEFPGIDAEAHDIRENEDGSFSVLAKEKPYRYNIDMLTAQRKGGELDLTGDLMYGEFGYAFSEFVCHASIRLVPNSDSPYGYTLTDMLLGLGEL